MGISINAQNNIDAIYAKAVRTLCSIFVVRTFSFFLRSDFIYRFTKYYQNEKKSIQTIHKITNSVIKKRKEADIPTLEENIDDFGRKSKMALLDLLLKSKLDGKALSDEDVREEVDTFMFAGHDTVSSGIAFTLHSVSRHPEVQNKIVEEFKFIFGDNSQRSATYQDLQNMKYLEMVIKETFRLYPPVPAYARHLEEDIDFGDVVVPKGSTVAVFCYGLHRLPWHFPDPGKFDPERFTLENTSRRHPYAYLPFSAGPRNCIGQKFAMLEIKSVVSKVLRHYELHPAGPELVLSMEGVLKSNSGIHLRVEERKSF